MDRGVRLLDFVGISETAIALVPQVFINVNALDESLPKHRLDIFGSRRDIIFESLSTRTNLTGRPMSATKLSSNSSRLLRYLFVLVGVILKDI